MNALVRSIMRDNVVTVSADDSLDTVDDIMNLGHVRHLPVVKAGELVGVVSQRDLLRASLSSISNVGLDEKKSFLNSVKIREVMSMRLITIQPDATLQEAAEIMADEKIGCLPVVENGHLIGMLTETDLLHHIAEAGRAQRMKARGAASRKKSKTA